MNFCLLEDLGRKYLQADDELFTEEKFGTTKCEIFSLVSFEGLKLKLEGY